MTIATDIAALQGVLAQSSRATTNFGSAVRTLQGAGNGAVGSIGPAIDASSQSDPATMQLTHSAWEQNGGLAGVTNDDGNTKKPDLDKAVALLGQMIALYTQANTQADRSALANSYVASAVGPPALGTGGTVEWVVTGAGGVVGVALGVRLLGLSLGGPIGLIAGVGVGLLLSMTLTQKVVPVTLVPVKGIT